MTAQERETLDQQFEREIREEFGKQEAQHILSASIGKKDKSKQRRTSPQPPKKKLKRENAVVLWAFTWNSYTEENITTLLRLPFISHLCFQEEDEGTPHLQGVLRLKVKKRKQWLKDHIDSGCHWEHCRSLGGSIRYCSMKSKRRNRKRYWKKGWDVDFDPENTTIEVEDPLEGLDLYSYQKEIYDIIVGKPHKRKIYWYYSKKGAVGKSSIVKSLCLKDNAVCIGGKFSDAQYAIAERVDMKRPVRILLFDIPRSQGNKVSYVALESIKNGCFFSSKYKSKQCLSNIPHIIVFANEPPQQYMLSEDRLVVRCLDDDMDLAHIK